MALLICVIGTTGSGKTFTVHQSFQHPLWITGCPGQMIRNSIGMYHAGDEENPNRFDLTEKLVRSYVSNLIEVADKVRRPIVLDGFPRDRQQAEWFFSTFAEHEMMLFVMKPKPDSTFHVEGSIEEKRHLRSISDVSEVMEEAVSRRILVKEFRTPWIDF